MFSRKRGRENAQVLEEVEQANPRPSSAFWDLSIALGRIAAVIVLVIVALILLRSPLHLRRHFDAVFPDHAFQNLGKAAGSTGERLHSAAADQLQSPESGEAAHPDHFSAGAPKKLVELVEGKPDQAAADVWEYGGSRVYFSGGRVVSWTSSPDHPLKAR